MPKRQEVVNVVLAFLLREQGVVAAPEEIFRVGLTGRRMPDVIVDYHGVRLAIEGEFEGTSAEAKACSLARSRVEEGLAHIGIAVVYPGGLRTSTFSTLLKDLAEAKLRRVVGSGLHSWCLF